MAGSSATRLDITFETRNMAFLPTDSYLIRVGTADSGRRKGLTCYIGKDPRRSQRCRHTCAARLDSASQARLSRYRRPSDAAEASERRVRFSSGSNNGFLIARPARQSVIMRGPEGLDTSYFVCETIDDFSRDVDQSELNQRGRVLQERALSRRTIYFTERQSYWECGGGVRCEMMTRMKNKRASFLGDPNFLRSVDQCVKRLKIQMFQDLYRQYSRLALSFSSDRLIAIRGFESRLINTFGTTGAVDIFKKYLHRSLLWQRAGNTLKTISGVRGVPVPSWSWMATMVPSVIWTFHLGRLIGRKTSPSPFAKDNTQDSMIRDPQSASGKGIRVSQLKLEAQIWSLLDAESAQIVMDEPGKTFGQPVHCVVIGRNETPMNEFQTYWVLLVHHCTRAENSAVYKRVRVSVLEKCRIAFDKPQGRGRIT
ncbi:hypothetical protein CIB48_g8459 [Xylaria polymorpha]|nr:hypothetical protein CIB48_g8459 [Xylaria polymorpha]